MLSDGGGGAEERKGLHSNLIWMILTEIHYADDGDDIK